MSAMKNNLGLGLATVALVLSAAASADPFGNGQFGPNFIDTIKAAAPTEPNAGFRAGGFLNTLKTTLGVTDNKSQIVDYPKPVTQSMLRIIAVAPPRGLEDQSIPVCAEKDNKVVGTWNITPKGEVVSVKGSWSLVSAEPTSSACKEFIIASRAEITRIDHLRGQGTPRVEAAPATPGHQ